MVSLSQVRASNALVSTKLPPHLVAVFVGATSGIGEYTLKAFAKHAKEPRVYFVGRSAEAGTRIQSECAALNPKGEYTFIQGDLSLLKNVDDVCRQIKEKEKRINLLVLSQGTLIFGTETEEGLHYAAALTHYSRVRVILNLLPLLQNASDLRRVVSIFAGTKEGPLDVSDMQARKVPLMAARGHATSLATFGLESLAKQAPEVGFVHVFPGFVKSGILRGTTGIMMSIFRILAAITTPFLSMDTGECGERHLFLCTSSRYPGKSNTDGHGVDLAEGVAIARGTNGENKSGVYSVDEYGESANDKVVEVLGSMRKEGVVEKVWKETIDDFQRITGSESI